MDLHLAAPLGALLLLSAPLPATAAEWHGIRISGFADFYFAAAEADLEDGDRNFAGLAAVASRADEARLDFGGVELRSEPSPFGFTLVLAGGDAMKVLHSAEPEWARDDFRYVYQASASWKAGPLLFEAGIFPSHIGFESAFPQGNWNYGHSWTATLSPFYQTGARVVYTPDDATTFELHLLNGWQEIADPNSGKSVGLKAGRRFGALTASLGTLHGEEPDGASGSALRSLYDLILQAPLAAELSAAFEAYYGRQERDAGGAAEWDAAAAWLRWQRGRHGLSLRAERFSDGDGGISGTAQRLESVTATWDLRLHPAAVLRLELRRDSSTAAFFADSRRQELAIAALALTFQ